MKNENNSEGTIFVAQFENDVQAHIAQGVLESHGIVSFLTNQTFSSIYPLGFNSIGGIRLWVNKADEKQAIELISGMGFGAIE